MPACVHNVSHKKHKMLAKNRQSNRSVNDPILVKSYFFGFCFLSCSSAKFVKSGKFPSSPDLKQQDCQSVMPSIV
jgi:hypothetical protein